MQLHSQPLDQQAKTVLIVGNPRSGSGYRQELLGQLQQAIARRGLEARLVTSLDGFGEIVAGLQAAGQLRAIVGAGGDGTVAEIVNRTAPQTPITVFPLGTANLLAKHFGIRRDPAALAEFVTSGHTVRLDAGNANGRVFLLMAGCGFDADVVHRLQQNRAGRHISYWTWWAPILASIRRYRYPELRIYCDGMPTGDAAHRARFAFVVNLPCYAGGLIMAPAAHPADGALNVCTFRRGSLWHGLRYVGYVYLAKHHWLRDHTAALAARVRIEADEPVPYQLDGDAGGMLPLNIEVLPARWTFVASQNSLHKRLGAS